MAQQLSQKDLAVLLGHRSSALVSRWETGQKTPTLDNALRLAHVLKAPVEALFADRVADLREELDARFVKLPSSDAPHDHVRKEHPSTTHG